jgi:hypothetical protein
MRQHEQAMLLVKKAAELDRETLNRLVRSLHEFVEKRLS